MIGWLGSRPRDPGAEASGRGLADETPATLPGNWSSCSDAAPYYGLSIDASAMAMGLSARARLVREYLRYAVHVDDLTRANWAEAASGANFGPRPPKGSKGRAILVRHSPGPRRPPIPAA